MDPDQASPAGAFLFHHGDTESLRKLIVLRGSVSPW